MLRGWQREGEQGSGGLVKSGPSCVPETTPGSCKIKVTPWSSSDPTPRLARVASFDQPVHHHNKSACVSSLSVLLPSRYGSKPLWLQGAVLRVPDLMILPYGVTDTPAALEDIVIDMCECGGCAGRALQGREAERMAELSARVAAEQQLFLKSMWALPADAAPRYSRMDPRAGAQLKVRSSLGRSLSGKQLLLFSVAASERPSDTLGQSRQDAVDLDT